MPFIDRDTNPNTFIYARFIRKDDKIYYAEANEIDLPHSRLAIIHHLNIGKYDENNQPLVDDGGWLTTNAGQLCFSDLTSSCFIRSKIPREARAKTIEITTNTLGVDKVSQKVRLSP